MRLSKLFSDPSTSFFSTLSAQRDDRRLHFSATRPSSSDFRSYSGLRSLLEVPIMKSTENNAKFIQSITGQRRVNQLGGMYTNGRPLPMETRFEIIRRSKMNVKPCDISRELKISHGAVSKILNRYAETGSISPGQIGGNPRQRATIQSVEKQIAVLKELRADWGAPEIRQELIDSGVCTKTTVPSVSSINRHLKNRGLVMKRVGGGRIDVPISSPTSSYPEPGWPLATPTNESPPTAKPKFSINEILAGNEERTQTSGQSSADERSASSTPAGRVRTNFAPHQVELLERAYERSPYPEPNEKEQLAINTGLDETKIQVWFSNRRARQRKIFSNNSVQAAEQLLRTPAAQQPSQCPVPSPFFQRPPPSADQSQILSSLLPQLVPLSPQFLCFPPNYSLLQLQLLAAQCQIPKFMP